MGDNNEILHLRDIPDTREISITVRAVTIGYVWMKCILTDTRGNQEDHRIEFTPTISIPFV